MRLVVKAAFRLLIMYVQVQTLPEAANDILMPSSITVASRSQSGLEFGIHVENLLGRPYQAYSSWLSSQHHW